MPDSPASVLLAVVLKLAQTHQVDLHRHNLEIDAAVTETALGDFIVSGDNAATKSMSEGVVTGIPNALA